MPAVADYGMETQERAPCFVRESGTPLFAFRRTAGIGGFRNSGFPAASSVEQFAVLAHYPCVSSSSIHHFDWLPACAKSMYADGADSPAMKLPNRLFYYHAAIEIQAAARIFLHSGGGFAC